MAELTTYTALNTKRREREAQQVLKRVNPVRPQANPTGSDFEFRSGATVRITNGRLSGQIATVLHSSNGWVQLTSNLGEIAKRAGDLELIEAASQSADSFPGTVRTARFQRTGRFGHTGDDDFDQGHGIDYLGQTPDPCTDSDGATDDDDEEQEDEIPDIWRALDIPMVTPAKAKARRAHIKKYVNKQAARLKSRNRPNLKYWLDRISGGTTKEQTQENIVPVDCCPVCKTAKWTGGKYCWNGSCSLSPAFARVNRLTSQARQQLLSVGEVSYDTTTQSAFATPSILKSATENVNSPKSFQSPLKPFAEPIQSSLSVHPSLSHVFSSAPLYTFDDMLGMRKRPREDSVSLTDCEARTPERNLSGDDLIAISYTSMEGIVNCGPQVPDINMR